VLWRNASTTQESDSEAPDRNSNSSSSGSNNNKRGLPGDRDSSGGKRSSAKAEVCACVINVCWRGMRVCVQAKRQAEDERAAVGYVWHVAVCGDLLYARAHSEAKTFAAAKQQQYVSGGANPALPDADAPLAIADTRQFEQAVVKCVSLTLTLINDFQVGVVVSIGTLLSHTDMLLACVWWCRLTL
jgi:hypothetical protein